MPTQTSLPLRSAVRHYRPVLVDLNCAALTLGRQKEQILEMVDCGDLRWVWDLASAQSKLSRRELRFFLGELFRLSTPSMPPMQSTLAETVELVIGHSGDRHLGTGTVCDLLQTQRQTVHYWLATGELSGPDQTAHRQLIYRDALKSFLTRRHAGVPAKG